nr:hypothetical protein GCM10011355_27610 [Aquisalinus luteolus]
MSTVENVIERIRAYKRETGISLDAFAKQAGLGGETSLRNFNKPEWSPTANTLRMLEAIIPEDYQPSEQVSDAA